MYEHEVIEIISGKNKRKPSGCKEISMSIIKKAKLFIGM